MAKHWAVIFNLFTLLYMQSVSGEDENEKIINDQESLESWFEEKAQCHQCRADRYEESFKLFDRNGDGVISKDELDYLMRSLGQSTSQAELDQTIEDIDQDGDGAINFEEFEDMMEIKMETSTVTEELEQAFQIFDKDKSGAVNFREMKSIMKSLGEDLSESRIKEMIAGADLDGDGEINLAEFTKMVSSRK